jgi:hypothetical protein
VPCRAGGPGCFRRGGPGHGGHRAARRPVRHLRVLSPARGRCRPCQLVSSARQHAPGRRGTIRACAQVSLQLAQQPGDPILLLHERQGDTIHPGSTAISADRSGPMPPTGRHPCAHGHTGRGTADPSTAWPQPTAGYEVVARCRRTPAHLQPALAPWDDRPWPAGVIGDRAIPAMP